MTAIWAYSYGAPGLYCEDARLLGGGTEIRFPDGGKVEYPYGTDTGQAGWDVGLMFHTLGELAEKLRTLRQDKGYSISRLAIDVHGAPGKILADGDNKEYDSTQLINKYSSQLALINMMLDPGAVVLFMGCQVASGDAGAQFLVDLSTYAFKGHQVVGFTTIGETLRQARPGAACQEPGMRDTPYDMPSAGMPGIQLQREKEALSLPWASEISPHAKIARNGEIIHGAEPSLSVDFNPVTYMPGSWSVTVGNWTGYFVFTSPTDVYWTDETMRRHPGKWSAFDGSVTWTFSDDDPNWMRRWEVILPLKSTVQGNVTIKEIPHGFFTMSKQF
ncbi:DUF4347 domain-containing protein [Bradyrhizobium jicamae]|uniref:DUF4347 domain-containing protein n=1 Tax=Bradyrhizobium jicamae TaxID=280332 RepID=A0ABS5FPB0_9BRAD|nr:DUF4347 domain-containing protein [Bradyrhizobium jicamae]MBR0798610.1 DUF4347 domain-containing protein [Bradyrhizobium jicamae]